MRDVAADLATILEAAGLGLQRPPGGSNLWVGRMPDDEAQAAAQSVAILETGGTQPTPYIGGRRKALMAVTCQVRVRSDPEDIQSGQQLARSVFRALNQRVVAPYVTIRARESSPFYAGVDNAERHIWTLNIESAWIDDGETAGTPIDLTDPGDRTVTGDLDVKGDTRIGGRLHFPDGTFFDSADLPIPPPPDLTPYATKSGTETLSNKTLAAPVVSGDLLPETAGQQSLGSAAVPWGAAFLMGQAGAVPLEIDQGAITNQRSIHIKNAGNGTTGIRYESTGGMGYWELARSGSWYQVTLANRSIRHMATGSAYDAASHTAWSYSDRVDTRVALAITGGVNPGRTADLLQLRPLEGSNPSESVARIGANGEIETVAGVILRSPSGTRYRITVADDGSLTTEPA